MKKKKFLGLIFIFAIAMILSACSLQKDKNIVSIEIIETTVPHQIVIGEFDDANIQAKVTYDDNTYETINITSTLLGDENQNLITKPGTYEIEIFFRGVSTTITINMIAATEQFTVKFFNGKNEIVSLQVIEEGEDAVAPNPSTCQIEGYNFIGWDRTFTNITENINVYGVYVKVTDTQNASDKLTFGVIKIEDVVGDDVRIVEFSGTQTPTREQLMPGDTITTDFTITLDEDSNDAWVRFKILASVSEDTYADVLGVKSYKVTNLLVEADGQTVKETVYFIYDNEEYVIEAGANVKKFVEGVATEVEDAEEAEVIKAAKNYVGEYVDLNNQTIVVTYAANEVVTGTDPETGAEIKEVKGVKATVTKNGVAFVPAEGVEGQDGYNANEQAKIEEAVAFGTTAVVRIDAVEEAIRLLNESMANQQKGNFYGTTVVDEQTGEVTLGDGWIYRAKKMTNATEGVQTGETHTEAVEYSYTIPRKTTGNALQGVQVDFNLVVEAVQYDNNTSAENTGVDITNIGAGVDATTNPAADCIRAFYVVEHEIVEAP